MKKIWNYILIFLLIFNCTSSLYSQTTVEKLTEINTIKNNIRTKLTSFGINMTGTTFGNYHTKIPLVPGGTEFSRFILTDPFQLAEPITANSVVYLSGTAGDFSTYRIHKVNPPTTVPTTALARGFITTGGTTGQSVAMTALWFKTVPLKKLTITPPTIASTKVFDGNNTVSLSAVGSFGNISSQFNTVSATAVATFDNANAASGKTITAVYTISGADSGLYLKPDNYTMSTGVISPKQLTISAPSVASTKTFDGNTSTTATPGTVSGLVSGFSTVTTAVTSATFNNETAGSGKTITVVHGISGTHANNYLAPVNYTMSTGVINQKQLTISGSVVTLNKTFDGNNTADVTTVGTLGGLVTGYTTVTPSSSATYADALAGTSKSVAQSFSISGTHASNYLAPVNINHSGNINQKQLTISGTVIANKVFDGNTNATVTTVGTLGGLVTGYTTVTPAATSVFNSQWIGFHQTNTTYTISGTHAANYIKPVNNTSLEALIDKKQLTISGTIVTTSKAYDGNTTAAVTTVGTLGGLVSGFSNVNPQAFASYNNSSVGTGKTITVVYSIAGGNDDLYFSPVNSVYTTSGEISQPLEYRYISLSGDLGTSIDVSFSAPNSVETIYLINTANNKKIRFRVPEGSSGIYYTFTVSGTSGRWISRVRSNLDWVPSWNLRYTNGWTGVEQRSYSSSAWATVQDLVHTETISEIADYPALNVYASASGSGWSMSQPYYPFFYELTPGLFTQYSSSTITTILRGSAFSVKLDHGGGGYGGGILSIQSTTLNGNSITQGPSIIYDRFRWNSGYFGGSITFHSTNIPESTYNSYSFNEYPVN